MGLTNLLFRFRKKKEKKGVALQTETACCICQKALSGKILRDAWNRAAHVQHRISFCNSCDRILSKSSGGAYQYSDGRLICGFCKKTAISGEIAANRSRRKVLDLLESAGFKGIPKNIKIVLAHPKTLSAHSGKHHTAGLTLSHFHFSDSKRSGITHQIGILFGLPKVEFEAVMAHELLHIWQHENDVKFSPLYREGFCELGSFLVYSDDTSDLSRHFLQKMKSSKDPVYGNGFRLMQKKLESLGWQSLIQEVLKNKRGFETSLLAKIMGKKRN